MRASDELVKARRLRLRIVSWLFTIVGVYVGIVVLAWLFQAKLVYFPSREIAYAVKSMEKPTLCWMGDIAASGAYWIASSCDHVMADPLSMTGSIGVTASYLEFSELFEKYGVTYEQITSGESKDIGSPFRNMTAEEREKFEYLTDEIFNYFLNDVIANRGLSETQVEQIKSGYIFLGKDAIDLGLVDSLGTMQDAKDRAKTLAGAEYADFVELRKSGISIFDLLGLM